MVVSVKIKGYMLTPALMNVLALKTCRVLMRIKHIVNLDNYRNIRFFYIRIGIVDPIMKIVIIYSPSSCSKPV